MDACVRGDTARARAVLVRSRTVRAAVARAERDIDHGRAPDTGEGVLLLARVRELAERVRHADDAVRLFTNRPLPPVDQLVESEQGAAAATDALVPAAWDYNTDVVLLVGPGLEPVARELCRQGQRRIIAYLPDGADHDYPSEVIVTEDHAQLTSAALMQSPNPPERIVAQFHPATDIDGDERVAVVECVQEALTEVRVHLNTISSFSKIWIAQGLANLPHIARSPTVAALDDSFRGKPMVIVAPGPSLAKNIDLLHQVKGKALLVTFSHTMKPLAAAGIVPDLVMCVDPQDVRYHFEGAPVTGIGAIINGVTVHPQLFELGAPRTLTFAANSTLDDWVYDGLGVESQLPSGGSVATAACALGLQWGCDPIVFVGLDLSFPDGQYYIDTSCDGGTEVEWSENDDTLVVKGWSEGFRNLHMVRGAKKSRVEKIVELPGYHGGMVRTNFMFSLFHRWFEDCARDNADTVRLINATEGGAKIEGTEQMPLADAIAQFMTAPLEVDAALDAAAASIDSDARMAILRRRVRDMVASVRSCIGLARRCLALTRRTASNSRALAELERREKQLAAAVKPVLFLSMLRQREIVKALTGADASSSLADNLAAASGLFETILDTCEWLEPQLASAGKKLSDGRQK